MWHFDTLNCLGWVQIDNLYVYDLNKDGPRYFTICSNSRCLSPFKHKQLTLAMMMRVVVGSKDHSFGSAPGAGGSEVNKVENGNKEGTAFFSQCPTLFKKMSNRRIFQHMFNPTRSFFKKCLRLVRFQLSQ